MNKAVVFDIQRGSFVDGPGIRTTVFLKGCNLKCAWCHNPESRSAAPQILFDKSKCIGCGRCAGITPESSDFVCLGDAKRICGKSLTTDEVYDEIIKDAAFYEVSGGGVTFSGGECMLQIDFLREILKKCCDNGIRTAVDTAGNVPWEAFEKVMPYTELFLYDIKLADGDKHRRYTGVSNGRILDNYKRLIKSNAHVWVRIPVIPSVNDDIEEMTHIRNLLADYRPEKTELLPYHAMGEHKYEELGENFEKFSVPSAGEIETLKGLFGI